MGPRLGPWLGDRNTAHSAGDSVSALIAEMIIETETATANCRNSSPEMPGMNATGTNTDSSTSVMAMIGAVISFIARRAASAGEIVWSFSSCASTASTTTIASSTTMPIASTSASSDTVLAEKPSASITANVPISDTGTAISGIRVARKLPRKRKTTTTTRTNASNSVCRTLLMLSLTKIVVS